MDVEFVEFPPNPHAAAFKYADLGWRVVPIAPGEKYPYMKDWRNTATTDGKAIESWWTGEYLGHGVGVVTGAASGIWVLDIDVSDEKNGLATLRGYEEANGDLPRTVVGLSGGGGRHYFFRWEDDRPVTNAQGQEDRLGSGIDIRGEGGQVVAAPTMHPSGVEYDWMEGQSPWEVKVLTAPKWLYDLILGEPGETEVAEESETPKARPLIPDDGDSIAEWVNDRYDWESVLGQDGWTFVRSTVDGDFWCRPGKDPRDGHSAVLHQPDGPLVVFSTEVANLRGSGTVAADGSGESFSLFGYLAAARHDGDRSGFARAQREEKTRSEKPSVIIESEPAEEPVDYLKSLIKAGSSTDTTIKRDDDAEIEPEWIPATDLDATVPTEVPAFPVHCLPDWMRPAIKDTASSKQVPIDMAGVFALGAFVTATTGRLMVRVAPGHEEPCNLWFVVAANPSEGKSPALNALASDPINDELAELRKKQSKTARELHGLLKQAESDQDWPRVDQLTEQIGAPPQMVTSDATPESFVRILDKQKRGVTILSDEGGPFLDLDRYNPTGKASPKLDIHLKGYSGGAVEVSRASSTISIERKHCNLSMLLAVQPDVLGSVWANPLFKGRGFLARFLVSVPESLVGRRDFINAPKSDQSVMHEYHIRLRRLVRHSIESDMAVSMSMSDGAYKQYAEFRQEVENARVKGGPLRGDDGAINEMKIDAAVARMSGILAFADAIAEVPVGGFGNVETTITDTHVLRAIEVVSYFVAHEGSLIGRLRASKGDTNTEAMLAKIRTMVVDGRVETGKWYGLRALQKKNRWMRGDINMATLMQLRDADWLKIERHVPKEGKREVKMIAFNPQFAEG